MSEKQNLFELFRMWVPSTKVNDMDCFWYIDALTSHFFLNKNKHSDRELSGAGDVYTDNVLSEGNDVWCKLSED